MVRSDAGHVVFPITATLCEGGRVSILHDGVSDGKRRTTRGQATAAPASSTQLLRGSPLGER